MDLVTSSAHPPGDERPSSPKLSRATQARVLLAVALGPLITGYAVVAALLALITVTAENTQFSTLDVLLAAGPGWLAAHQVPIAINGHPLGLLPLLPAIGGSWWRCELAAGNLASLLSGIGRGGLQFVLIIWLQGIYLPRHGYSFAD